MKYICKDCGKEYARRPHFCECGNDTFQEVHEEIDVFDEQQSRPYTGRIKSQSVKEEKPAEQELVYEEEKTSPFTVIFMIIVIAALAFFVPRFLQKQANNANDEDAKYLDGVMQTVMGDFNPAGITQTGECIMRFEVNEAGWVNKRAFVQRSSVPEINSKVAYALRKATLVEKPPKRYTDVPLRLKVSCTADEKMAECMGGVKIDETPVLPPDNK